MNSANKYKQQQAMHARCIRLLTSLALPLLRLHVSAADCRKIAQIASNCTQFYVMINIHMHPQLIVLLQTTAVTIAASGWPSIHALAHSSCS
jgi:hypothetical protein